MLRRDERQWYSEGPMDGLEMDGRENREGRSSERWDGFRSVTDDLYD